MWKAWNCGSPFQPSTTALLVVVFSVLDGSAVCSVTGKSSEPFETMHSGSFDPCKQIGTFKASHSGTTDGFTVLTAQAGIFDPGKHLSTGFIGVGTEVGTKVGSVAR